MAVKYYVYISDTKVEMIYSQIPVPLRKKLSVELKVDLKVVGTTLKPSTPPETRYSKVDMVRRFLEDSGDVGTVSSPGPYVAGQTMMRWGTIREGRLVYFGGTMSSVVVGLAGARRHVIGAPGAASTPETIPLSSSSVDLIEALGAADPNIVGLPMDMAAEVTGSLDEFVAYSVLHASRGMRGPRQTLEFLAKRVGEARIDAQRVLLASPIYVSQVD
ncbi:hypothetical protein KOI35_26285 [Actinoplanes bogorensis]|uniref:Uncharacterized protein n=1 Tax=Paractinoplanes bogorensis TaxID=1610840 RepID=A0ABS5YVD0_9ACTN|nr:SAVMC3_10250 family protein [Actinoplanes bogorensis]MBU2667026.1 hypothetical protein [Actinoplanes bogorensis]